MRRIFLAFAVAASAAIPAAADTRGDVRLLYDALEMSEVIGIMQDEGRDYGSELRDELFPGRGGPAWTQVVDRLYDAAAMDDLVLAEFERQMQGVALEPLIAFFTSQDGERIVRLELEARRAMMDDAIEEAAKDRVKQMRNDDAPRLDLLDRFIEANELVDSNVVGALNSNYAFYLGLMEGGAFGNDMTEESILTDVWSQEADIRAETIDWVWSYLSLAYQPLDDAEIEEYTAISASDGGRALNRAIFGAFDEMYKTISRGLGQGAAQFILGEDL